MGTVFLFSLAGGMLAVLATGRTGLIAWKFLRFVGLVALALASLATIWGYQASPTMDRTATGILACGVLLGAASTVVVFLAPWAERRELAFRAVCLVGGMFGLAAAAAGSLGTLPEAARPIGMVAALVSSRVLGGLMLGSITVAWLLGHAYLTATRMTIAPLQHFSRLLSLTLVVRLLFVLLSLGAAWILGGNLGVEAGVTTAAQRIVPQLISSWLIVSLRVGVGLIAVGAFVYMVADCVRLRSTQSATGILYFGSVFAYVGELASQQLIADYAWPL